MKVRHKQTGEVFKDGWLHPQEQIWKVITEHDERKEFMGFACEPIPDDEVWEDITEDCYEVVDGSERFLCYQGQCLHTLEHRLVKEQLWRHTYGEHYSPVEAFRIKKKVTR